MAVKITQGSRLTFQKKIRQKKGLNALIEPAQNLKYGLVRLRESLLYSRSYQQRL